MSKKYLQKKGAKDLHTYGETPLKTFEEIAKQLGIKANDRVLELGSGRGRGAFFLAHFYDCLVTGIERIPQFVKLARHVAKEHEVKNISFECADMFENEWPDVNVIYLYGTCLSDQEIEQLIQRFKTLPKGTRILSISYPLNEYDQSNGFRTIKQFPVSYPWGETEAYVNVSE